MTKPTPNLRDRLPTTQERSAAEPLRSLLDAAAGKNDQVFLKVMGKMGVPVEVEVAPALLSLLAETLGYVANGAALSITHIPPRLSVQQAAAVLNVPRPYLASLLKNGALDWKREGAKRYVATADLLNYQQTRDSQRAAALDTLAQLDADLI